MCDIRERLLAAANGDSLLETAYQLYSKNSDNSAAVGKELALLHNQGHLNAIDEFIELNKSSIGHKFFTIRQIFEEALPEINAPVLDVMKCVKHLTEQAGQEMSAEMFFSPFIAYCEAKDDRPSTVLGFAVDKHEDWKDFISPAIIAGTRIKSTKYIGKAIELSLENNIDISSRALIALRSVNYGEDANLDAKVLELLNLVVQGVYNDKLFAAVLRTSYSLYLADKTKKQSISDLIEVTLEMRGDHTLLAASKLFIFERETLPDSIVSHMFKAFEDINPKNDEALNNIDYGLEGLLEKGQGEKVLSLLDKLLIKNGNNFSISQFENTARGLLKNQNNILSKTITRWLMSGAVRLGRSASELINDFGGKNTIISADIKQLQFRKESDGSHLFLAKKACGWFFFNPVSAASFILSLIDTASDDEVNSISEILFNPLLISYSGSVKEHLQNLPDNSTKKIKDVVAQLLSDLNSYHEGLKSARGLKELEPTVAQREAYQRKWSREISASYKKARQGSFFGQIFGKQSILLYGNSSIHYIHHGPEGETSRQEIPLQSISTSIEFPSLENLAPHELEMKLRNFKLEGCTS